jgi:polysaccharide biosynthesis protein PelA
MPIVNERAVPRDRGRDARAGQSRRIFLKAGAGLLSAAAMSGAASDAQARGDAIRWLVFYGITADEAVLASYDIVVLDPAFQGSISLGPGTRVHSYLSLAEMKTDDRFFPLVDPAALLDENPQWPGTRRIDIRHPSWRSVVLDRQIPSIAAMGFAGLMLDTLDTAPFLERQDSVGRRGTRAAAIDLVRSIRARWPGLALIVNRGYELLPELVAHIDGVIAESFMTRPDTMSDGFAWTEARQQRLELSMLRATTTRDPPVPVLSLDYWDPDDSGTIAEIYRRERALGHHPYVATRLLDRIVAEEG